MEGIKLHRCGLYDFIRVQPGAELMPAFGAGCCRTLFNDNRRRILRMIANGTIQMPPPVS